MIQFNLLPDVKLEFIKARRAKRLVMLLSFTGTAVMLFVVIVLFIFVDGAQKKHISDLNKDIKSYSDQLKGTANLDKVLTIQNQLNSLAGLHDQKPVAPRLFGYINSLTPAQASISKFKIDFNGNTITITGTADSISTINKFVDTLKFTNYTLTDPKTGKKTTQKAFSNTVLTAFTRNDKGATDANLVTTYQIDSGFDHTIFDSNSIVSLVVPNTITTRSETEKPTALFQTVETTTTGTSK